MHPQNLTVLNLTYQLANLLLTRLQLPKRNRKRLVDRTQETPYLLFRKRQSCDPQLSLEELPLLLGHHIDHFVPNFLLNQTTKLLTIQ
jgi:hypothetical protein